MKKTSLLIALLITCLGAFGQIQKVIKPFAAAKLIQPDSIAVFTFGNGSLLNETDKLNPNASVQMPPVVNKVRSASLPLKNLKFGAAIEGGNIAWDENIFISAFKPYSIQPCCLTFNREERSISESDRGKIVLNMRVPQGKEYLVRIMVSSSFERDYELNVLGQYRPSTYRILGEGEIVFIVNPRNAGFMRFELKSKSVDTWHDKFEDWTYKGLSINEL